MAFDHIIYQLNTAAVCVCTTSKYEMYIKNVKFESEIVKETEHYGQTVDKQIAAQNMLITDPTAQSTHFLDIISAY